MESGRPVRKEAGAEVGPPLTISRTVVVCPSSPTKTATPPSVKPAPIAAATTSSAARLRMPESIEPRYSQPRLAALCVPVVLALSRGRSRGCSEDGRRGRPAAAGAEACQRAEGFRRPPPPPHLRLGGVVPRARRARPAHTARARRARRARAGLRLDELDRAGDQAPRHAARLPRHRLLRAAHLRERQGLADHARDGARALAHDRRGGHGRGDAEPDPRREGRAKVVAEAPRLAR